MNHWTLSPGPLKSHDRVRVEPKVKGGSDAVMVTDGAADGG